MELNIDQAREMTLNNLALAPKDRAVTLLMRHSLRYEIKDETFGNEVPLKPEGRVAAKQLGEDLDRPILTVFSSPVGRCLDTAKHMLEGQGKSHPVLEDERLGDPGAYILKGGEAGKEYMRLGHHEFFGQQMAGKPVKGTRTLAQGSKILLDWVTEPTKAPGLHLKVTHDAILGLLVAHFIGLNAFSDPHWPKMLEGMALWSEEGKVVYAWRGVVGLLRVR